MGYEQDAGQKFPSGRGAHVFEEVTHPECNKEEQRFPLWVTPQVAKDSPFVKESVDWHSLLYIAYKYLWLA